MYKTCICCGRELEEPTYLEDFYMAETCENCEMRVEELKESKRKEGENGES